MMAAFRISVRDIQALVASRFGILEMEMRSARRGAGVVRPRQVAMYLARRHTLRSLPEIGMMFGSRDHTTVIHAVRRIESLREENADLDQNIRECEKVIGSGRGAFNDETRASMIAASYIDIAA